MINNNYQLMQKARSVSATVVRLWGTGALGTEFVSAYFSPNPWITVAELAERVHLGEAQTRRRLDQLVSLGRAMTRQKGKAMEYMAEPQWAERTVETWRTFCLSLQNAKDD